MRACFQHRQPSRRFQSATTELPLERESFAPTIADAPGATFHKLLKVLRAVERLALQFQTG